MSSSKSSQTMYAILVTCADGCQEIFGGARIPKGIGKGLFRTIDDAVAYLNDAHNLGFARENHYQTASIVTFDGELCGKPVRTYEFGWFEKENY